jgi:hypothetical protein
MSRTGNKKKESILRLLLFLSMGVIGGHLTYNSVTWVLSTMTIVLGNGLRSSPEFQVLFLGLRE